MVFFLSPPPTASTTSSRPSTFIAGQNACFHHHSRLRSYGTSPHRPLPSAADWRSTVVSNLPLNLHTFPTPANPYTLGTLSLSSVSFRNPQNPKIPHPYPKFHVSLPSVTTSLSLMRSRPRLHHFAFTRDAAISLVFLVFTEVGFFFFGASSS
jgi:hypothetical protein